jgi:adenylate cyclase
LITGYHLWSENYDRDLSDIFSLQDEITLKIIETMEIKLTFGEQARLWAGGTKSIQAYDKLTRGMDYAFKYNGKDNKHAQQFYNEAINIDTAYALAYAMLGLTHILDLIFKWSKSPLQSFAEAEKNIEKALNLNDSLDIAHSVLGLIYLLKRQHDEAIKEGELAIELNPNGAEAHTVLATILIYSGKTELAIKLLKRALRLNPIPLSHYYSDISVAYRVSERYEKAIKYAKKGLCGNLDQLTPYLTLAACYSSLNRTEEAYKAAKEVLRIDPNFSLEYHSAILPYKNKTNVDKLINALRKAGLPE